MSLKITDSKNSFLLPKNKCVPLELIVNKFDDKDYWRSIGDHLYYYVNPNITHRPKDVLLVNTEQFLKLHSLVSTI
jgi:hypothetical protein